MFVVTSLVSEPAVFATPPIRTEWIVLAVVITWLLWRWVQAAALHAVIRTADPSIGPLLLLRVFKPSVDRRRSRTGSSPTGGSPRRSG